MATSFSLGETPGPKSETSRRLLNFWVHGCRFILLPLVMMMVLNPCTCFCGNAFAAEGSPFRPGEQLTYDLFWELIPAGTAQLEVSPVEELDGRSAYHFVMTVKSNSVIDRFYKVRDRIESYTDKPMKRSLLYTKKQQEGRHRRDIVVSFNWDRLLADYSNFGKKQKPVAIVDGTFDPLSILYAFRLMPLKEDAVVEIPVSDGKKSVIGKVRIAGRERIRVNGRKVETFVLEPDLKDLGGIFRKSKGASVRIWVTDDESRVPVKVASKVAVGYFVAELKDARNVPLNVTGK